MSASSAACNVLQDISAVLPHRTTYELVTRFTGATLAAATSVECPQKRPAVGLGSTTKSSLVKRGRVDRPNTMIFSSRTPAASATRTASLNQALSSETQSVSSQQSRLSPAAPSSLPSMSTRPKSLPTPKQTFLPVASKRPSSADAPFYSAPLSTTLVDHAAPPDISIPRRPLSSPVPTRDASATALAPSHAFVSALSVTDLENCTWPPGWKQSLGNDSVDNM